MQPTYHTETHEKRIKNVVLTVSNTSPVYTKDEKTVVKKKIEEQLYEVFYKYMPEKS